MKKNIFAYIISSFFLIAIVFYAGFATGKSYIPAVDKINFITNKENTITENADFNTFWKVWSTLNEKSIYANKTTNQNKVYGAAAGLASSFGDPYTVFFNPEENKTFNSEIKGSFSGIGAEIDVKDKILTIIAPLKDSPAMKAGLRRGDKILKIDTVVTNDMTVEKAISLIRGEKGTEVSLVILHEGEQISKEIKIKRDTIEIPTIDTKTVSDDIFVISLYSFSENSAVLFKKAFKEFKDTKYNKLIIDLRGNPGGYLDSAVEIGSLFVDEGKTIVTEDFGGKKDTIVYRSQGASPFSKDNRVIVLIDGGSASASEILAGALKQNNVARLVGEKSFGKGSVQELVKINDETSLKVTIGSWLTPDGSSISKKGIEPDFIVPFTIEDLKNKKDPALEKAIKLLKN